MQCHATHHRDMGKGQQQRQPPVGALRQRIHLSRGLHHQQQVPQSPLAPVVQGGVQAKEGAQSGELRGNRQATARQLGGRALRVRFIMDASALARAGTSCQRAVNELSTLSTTCLALHEQCMKRLGSDKSHFCTVPLKGAVHLGSVLHLRKPCAASSESSDDTHTVLGSVVTETDMHAPQSPGAVWPPPRERE